MNGKNTYVLVNKAIFFFFFNIPNYDKYLA